MRDQPDPWGDDMTPVLRGIVGTLALALLLAIGAVLIIAGVVTLSAIDAQIARGAVEW